MYEESFLKIFLKDQSSLKPNFFPLTNAANFRSVSAVDSNAAQRARARAQYANMNRLKMTPGTASLRKYSSFQ